MWTQEAEIVSYGQARNLAGDALVSGAKVGVV